MRTWVGRTQAAIRPPNRTPNHRIRAWLSLRRSQQPSAEGKGSTSPQKNMPAALLRYKPHARQISHMHRHISGHNHDP